MLKTIKNRIQESNNPFIRSIVRHAPNYMIGSVFSALLGMIMVKYYTKVFDPKAYGVLALYIMLIKYVGYVISFTVESSFQRVYFEFKDKQRKQFLGTVIIFMLASSIFWILLSVVLAKYIVSSFGGTYGMYVCAIVISFLIMFVQFYNRLSYNEQLSGLVLRQGIIGGVVEHFVSVLMISVAKLGLLGREIGMAVGNVLNFLIYGKGLKKKKVLSVEWVFEWKIMRKVLHFAIPTFLSVFFVRSLSYLDKIFLNHFHGSEEVGIYSLGQQIGLGINIVVESLSLALFPSIMVELKKDFNGSIARLKKLDLIFWSCLVVAALLGFVFRDQIVLLLSNKSFLGASIVLPFIFFSYVLGGFYKTVSFVIAYKNIVWYIPVLSLVSYGCSAGLNYLLIPSYHEIGAAYATFVGAFIFSLVTHIIGSKYYFNIWFIILVYTVIFSAVTLTFLGFIGIV